MLPLHPGLGTAGVMHSSIRRTLVAAKSQNNNPLDFPPNYVPPTYKPQQQQSSKQPVQGRPPPSPNEQQFKQPPPFSTPGVQRLTSGSELRQQQIERSLHKRERAVAAAAKKQANLVSNNNEPSPQGRGNSLSDRQLDEVVTYSLGSWFVGAPPVHAPKPLQPGILDHEDPHVVCKAINGLVETRQLEEAVKAVTHIVTKNRKGVLNLFMHQPFLEVAAESKASRQAFNLMRVLPPQFCFQKSFTMALDVCAQARDLATGTALYEMAEKTLSQVGKQPDLKLMTTYIKVCKSAGNSDKAYSVFLAMKKQRMRLDAHVYCTVIAAFGEAMHRELTVAHERKDQYVLLERAFAVLMDAESLGVTLNQAPWNAVLTCAGRCGQLRRGFEILDLMEQHGVEADVISLGSIVEACVLAGNAELALKMFNRVLAGGFDKTVELYTQAVSACKLRGFVDLDTALKIYTHMQHNNIQPDKKFFAALTATAGAAGRLDLAFEMLSDVQSEGIMPGSTVCSGLILACIKDRRFLLAQKVYDICADKGIYPTLSLFNNLMDWYASELRLGDVVRLLTDMTQHAHLQPNINTYRILLNACQRTDQGALAFEIYEVMKAKHIPILQERMAQSVYYLLLKCCLNQQRYIWEEVLQHENNAMAPWRNSMASRRTVLMGEAEQVLCALGSSLQSRGSRSLLLKDCNVSTWANRAVAAYRDMTTKGWKPNYDVLNMLLSCMRMPLQALQAADRIEHEDDQLIKAAGGNGMHGASAAADMAARQQPDLDRVQTSPNAGMHGAFRRYDSAFDSRAVALVEDAIARYALPRFTVDKDFVADLCGMPPVLAEVYVMTIFAAWERRAARARAQAGVDQSAAGSSTMFFHRLRLLVPPFPVESVNWPSYVVREREPSFSSMDADKGHPSWRGLTDSAARPRSPGSRYRFPKHLSSGNSHKTGCAVAATCLRMKVFANFNPSEGIIDLTPTEIVKWVRARHIWQLRMRGMLGVSGAPQGAVAQASFAAHDEFSAPSIESADIGRVDGAFVRGGAFPSGVGSGGTATPGRPFVVQPPGAKQSMQGESRGIDTSSSQGFGQNRQQQLNDVNDSDSDAERNDFGAWSPMGKRLVSTASRLQQQTRDIRLGLGPQVKRPPSVSGEGVKRPEGSSL